MESEDRLDEYIERLLSTGLATATLNKVSSDDEGVYYNYNVLLRPSSNIQVSGHGSSNDESQAIRIAFSEAYERLIVFENQFSTSNGCAVHTNLDTAIENAKNELIERDCFLTLFYLAHDYSKSEILNLKNFVGQVYPGAKYYCLHSAENICIVMALECSLDKFLIGLGVGKSLSGALTKATQELMRQIIFYKYHPQKSNNYYQNFLNCSQHSPADHGLLAFDETYRSCLKKHFSKSYFVNYEIPPEPYFIINFSSRTLVDAPLHFVRAVNENAQQLFFGLPEGKISLSRMRGFKEDFSNSTIPHPLK